MLSTKFSYIFDLNTNEVKHQCDLKPTEVTKSTAYWLHAENNKYGRDTLEPAKIGKWMLFLSKEEVNATWDKIKQAVTSGDLWHSKVSTTEVSPVPNRGIYAIMIYTKDYTDLVDVINVLDYLEDSGIKARHTTIRYKTDQQTRAGVYSASGQKASIYDSNTIRGGV